MLLNDSESRIFEQINTKDTPYYGINRVIDGDAEELEEMPAPQKVYVLTKVSFYHPHTQYMHSMNIQLSSQSMSSLSWKMSARNRAKQDAMLRKYCEQ